MLIEKETKQIVCQQIYSGVVNEDLQTYFFSKNIRDIKICTLRNMLRKTMLQQHQPPLNSDLIHSWLTIMSSESIELFWGKMDKYAQWFTA